MPRSNITSASRCVAIAIAATLLIACACEAETIAIRGDSSSTYTFFEPTSYDVTFRYTGQQVSPTPDLAIGVPQTLAFSTGQFTTTQAAQAFETQSGIDQRVYVGNTSKTLTYGLTINGDGSDFGASWHYNGADPLRFYTSQGEVVMSDFARSSSTLDASGTLQVTYSAAFELVSLERGVPEPSSLAIMALGALGLLIAGRRTRSSR